MRKTLSLTWNSFNTFVNNLFFPSFILPHPLVPYSPIIFTRPLGVFYSHLLNISFLSIDRVRHDAYRIIFTVHYILTVSNLCEIYNCRVFRALNMYNARGYQIMLRFDGLDLSLQNPRIPGFYLLIVPFLLPHFDKTLSLIKTLRSVIGNLHMQINFWEFWFLRRRCGSEYLF